MATREDYPMVGRTGYRVSGPLDPGMRSQLSDRERGKRPTWAKPDRTTDRNRELASSPAGFGQ